MAFLPNSLAQIFVGKCGYQVVISHIWTVVVIFRVVHRVPLI